MNELNLLISDISFFSASIRTWFTYIALSFLCKCCNGMMEVHVLMPWIENTWKMFSFWFDDIFVTGWSAFACYKAMFIENPSTINCQLPKVSISWQSCQHLIHQEWSAKLLTFLSLISTTFSTINSEKWIHSLHD